MEETLLNIKKPVIKKPNLQKYNSQLLDLFLKSEIQKNKEIIVGPENIYNSTSDLIKILEETRGYYQSIGLEAEFNKKIEAMILRLGQNAVQNSPKSIPANISIYQKIENNQAYICVETENHIDLSDISQQKDFLEFKRRLRNANLLSQKEIQSKFIEKITNRQAADKSTGLGILKIAKNNKESDSDKPFEYSFKERRINGKSFIIANLICKLNIEKSQISKDIHKEAQESVSKFDKNFVLGYNLDNLSLTNNEMISNNNKILENQPTQTETSGDILTNKSQEIEKAITEKKKLITKFRGKKTSTTKADEINESRKMSNEREMALMSIVDEKIETGDINPKTGKKINIIGVEILRNISCYSHIEKPIIFLLTEEEKDGLKKYTIKSRNYFLDSDGKNTQALENMLKKANEADEESIKKEYKERLKILKANEADLNEYGNAGLGYLGIAKSLRETNNNPFVYEFTKQKDGTVKFDLTIIIPDQIKKEKKESKEENFEMTDK